jgi:nucleoside-diphosphate-sugar epimerase
MSTVLVTGGSGFVAGYAILRLLADGHVVRTTLRNLSRQSDVRAILPPNASVTFVAADLERDDGWAAAAAGCEYVLHVASPFPASTPEDENEVITPARDGALRVLRAARDAGVRRVVMTSSFAAIGYGHPERTTPFDETTWTDLNSPGLTPYVKSKTIAERAAWDFIQNEGGSLELAVVNPVGIFGPVLGRDFATSILLVKRLMDGATPGLPKLYFGIVDVRDVANLHVLAMAHPAARGERFLAVAGDFLSVKQIAEVLKRRMGAASRKVPTRQLPNWLVRLIALRNPAVKSILPELGKVKNASSAKAERLLGWTHRSADDALVATADSLARRAPSQ